MNMYSSFAPGDGLSSSVCIYYTHIDAFLDLPGLSLLTEERRKRLFRYRKQEDRARCLAAGLLLRQIAKNEPEKTVCGKPYFPRGPQFNISHSGDYILLAVAHEEVGVDVEVHQAYDMRIAHRCFSPAELAWMRRQEDGTGAFYTLWTAKECIMKATGEGFRMPPETFEVDVIRALGLDAHGRRWHLTWSRLPNHTVCVGCGNPSADIRMTKCGIKELLK